VHLPHSTVQNADKRKPVLSPVAEPPCYIPFFTPGSPHHIRLEHTRALADGTNAARHWFPQITADLPCGDLHREDIGNQGFESLDGELNWLSSGCNKIGRGVKGVAPLPFFQLVSNGVKFRELLMIVSGRVRNARPKQQIVIYAHSGPWWV